MALAAPVTVRPVRLADARAMQEFVQALEPAARRMRFHGAINGCSPALLRRLTDADGVRHVAFVALGAASQGGIPAITGEARYVVTADGDSAEFAICVSAAVQGCGVADALMRHLLAAARAAGIGWLYGDVLADNARMPGFMRRHGFTLASDVDAGAGVERWQRAVAERPQRCERGFARWLSVWCAQLTSG